MTKAWFVRHFRFLQQLSATKRLNVQIKDQYDACLKKNLYFTVELIRYEISALIK